MMNDNSKMFFLGHLSDRCPAGYDAVCWSIASSCGVQQVDQQSRQLCLIEQPRDIAIAGTVTTAAAAVSKQHDRAGFLRQVQVALDRYRTGRYADQPFFDS